MKKIILVFSLIFIILSKSLLVFASDSVKQSIKITTEIPYNYTVTLIARGNGYILANNISIRDSHSITCDRHSNVELNFKPDVGYKLSRVFLDNKDITSSIQSNKYVINKITKDYTVTAAFEKIPIQEEVNDFPNKVISSIGSIINDSSNYIDTDTFYNFIKPSIAGANYRDEDVGNEKNSISNFTKTGDTLSNYVILSGVCILCIVVIIRIKKE